MNRDFEIAARIQERIAEITGITVERINGKECSRAVVDARQLCMFFIKDKTSLSQCDIAMIMRKRNHGPVHHGLKKYRDMLNISPKFRARIQTMRQRLDEIK